MRVDSSFAPDKTILVCGGQWHDFDFARRKLMELLEYGGLPSVNVFEDYDLGNELSETQSLITYTCNVLPSPEQQEKLVEFVSRGGRWLALHATNSVLVPPEPQAPRIFHTPKTSGPFMSVLGSRFLAHPPMGTFKVEVTDSNHPLVHGIEDFEVADEIYVSELYPPIEVLLHAKFKGACPSFALAHTVDDEPRPVLYLKTLGAGAVCYFTLGHCRGRFDLLDLGVADTGYVERGSWNSPVFNEILRRAVDWVTGNMKNRTSI